MTKKNNLKAKQVKHIYAPDGILVRGGILFSCNTLSTTIQRCLRHLWHRVRMSAVTQLIQKKKLRNLHSHEILTSHQKMGVEKVPT